MTTREQNIVSVIKDRIEKFETSVTVANVGTVIEVGDGIARIHGLGHVGASELLEFPHEIMGLALNLEEDNVGAAILGGKAAGQKNGGFDRVEEGQAKACRLKDKVFRPRADARAVYDQLFQVYLALHNSLGGVEKSADLGGAMKKLLELKKAAAGSAR